MRDPIDAPLLGHVGLEPAALLVGVGQLVEGVGEFDAAGVEFEALGDARVDWIHSRQRRLGRRIVVRMAGRPIPRWGSTRSLRSRLNTSDQVSSAATRRPTACAWRARRAAFGAPPGGRLS